MGSTLLLELHKKENAFPYNAFGILVSVFI